MQIKRHVTGCTGFRSLTVCCRNLSRRLPGIVINTGVLFLIRRFGSKIVLKHTLDITGGGGGAVWFWRRTVCFCTRSHRRLERSPRRGGQIRAQRAADATTVPTTLASQTGETFCLTCPNAGNNNNSGISDLHGHNTLPI